MASRVAASYVEVLQTDGASARVTQESAEVLTGAGAAKARVTSESLEALLGGNPAARGRVTALSAEVLRSVGDNIAVARVAQLSVEVLRSVSEGPTGPGQRTRVVWVA